VWGCYLEDKLLAVWLEFGLSNEYIEKRCRFLTLRTYLLLYFICVNPDHLKEENWKDYIDYLTVIVVNLNGKIIIKHYLCYACTTTFQTPFYLCPGSFRLQVRSILSNFVQDQLDFKKDQSQAYSDVLLHEKCIPFWSLESARIVPFLSVAL